ncbi:MAG: hypothetical protein ACLPJJ_09530 [Acidocella sp.]|uniref:hypothetical protein n=1 Tax=Acidocella sp. TaxID=50710 RepID=UPI003FC7AC95
MINRFGISAIALAVLAVFVWLHGSAPGMYFAVLAAFDIPKAAQPFSDLGAVLQAIHCAGQGVNVYEPNACMGGGNYNYSPLLLHFGELGALAPRLNLAGLGLGALFIAALAVLPPSQSRAEFWLRALASGSASTVFALERMNLDVVIFLLAMGGIWLSLRGSITRLAGDALFCFAAALKYYPVALLVLLLREPPRRLAAMVALLGVAGLGFLVWFGAGTLAALAIVPHGPPFGNCFGAIDIPLGISLGIAAVHGNTLHDLSRFNMPLALRLAYVAMILAALWRGWVNAALYRPAMERLEPAAEAFLIGGAALICACFFMAQNIDYRSIFLLLTLPGVFALHRAGVAKAGWLAIAIVALLWESFFRIAAVSVMPVLAGQAVGYSAVIMVWVGREVLWWWVVTQFLAQLCLYTRAAFSRALA